MSLFSKLMAGVVLVGLSGPTLAQDHEEHHTASVGAVVFVHAWTRAAAAGGDGLVFFEVENGGEPILLSGARSDVAASVEMVGAKLGSNAMRDYQVVGPFEIPSGDFHFDPDGLALRLNGLTQALVQGEEIEVELMLGAEDLHLHVAVEAENATQHSHAGHSH